MIHCRPLASILAAAVFLLLTGAPSQAQIIQLEPPSSNGAAPERDLPPVQPPTAPPPDLAERGRDAPAQAEAPSSDSQPELVPLRPSRLRTSSAAATRLTGEAGSDSFILFLPNNPGATEIQISHRSGIDTLPEQSSLSIVVNDTEVGQIRPDNFSGFGIAMVPVPDGVLREGRNIVQIRARHTHRVACGPDASFALWTDIDHARSGIMVSRDSFSAGPVGFLAAVAAQAGRGDPISIRRSDPNASLLDAAPFIGQVAASLGGLPPEIVSTPYWTLAKDAPELARITVLPPGEGPPQPRFARGGDGAMVLMIELGTDYGTISDALMETAQSAGMPAPPLLTPGQTQTLSDLGSPRLTGQGRYILMSVDFVMPWNWLLLASQKARLDLDYRFAAGLPEGALLLVKVNGETIRLLPLDRSGGQSLPTLPIDFGARLLTPGTNRLEFEALIPGDPPDAACLPIDTPVLEISEGSTLFVPASPQMAIPSIDMSLAMLSPENISLTDAAAAQLPPGIAPQIAASLQPQHQQYTPRSAQVRLRIASLADLSSIQPAPSTAAMRELQNVLSSDFIRQQPQPAPPTAWDIIERPQNMFSLRRLDTIAELPGQLQQWVTGLIFGQTPPLHEWLAGREAQAALLQPDPARPGDIWLVFAPHADPSSIVWALSAGRGGDNRATGQVALYAPDEGWVSWADPARPLILQEALTWNNLRPIIGNYATRLPLVFLGAVLMLTLLSALVALMILKLTRRHTP